MRDVLRQREVPTRFGETQHKQFKEQLRTSRSHMTAENTDSNDGRDSSKIKKHPVTNFLRRIIASSTEKMRDKTFIKSMNEISKKTELFDNKVVSSRVRAAPKNRRLPTRTSLMPTISQESSFDHVTVQGMASRLENTCESVPDLTPFNEEGTKIPLVIEGENDVTVVQSLDAPSVNQDTNIISGEDQTSAKKTTTYPNSTFIKSQTIDLPASLAADSLSLDKTSSVNIEGSEDKTLGEAPPLLDKPASIQSLVEKSLKASLMADDKEVPLEPLDQISHSEPMVPLEEPELPQPSNSKASLLQGESSTASLTAEVIDPDSITTRSLSEPQIQLSDPSELDLSKDTTTSKFFSASTSNVDSSLTSSNPKTSTAEDKRPKSLLVSDSNTNEPVNVSKSDVPKIAGQPDVPTILNKSSSDSSSTNAPESFSKKREDVEHPPSELTINGDHQEVATKNPDMVNPERSLPEEKKSEIATVSSSSTIQSEDSRVAEPGDYNQPETIPENKPTEPDDEEDDTTKIATDSCHGDDPLKISEEKPIKKDARKSSRARDIFEAKLNYCYGNSARKYFSLIERSKTEDDSVYLDKVLKSSQTARPQFNYSFSEATTATSIPSAKNETYSLAPSSMKDDHEANEDEDSSKVLKEDDEPACNDVTKNISYFRRLISKNAKTVENQHKEPTEPKTKRDSFRLVP